MAPNSSDGNFGPGYWFFPDVVPGQKNIYHTLIIWRTIAVIWVLFWCWKVELDHQTFCLCFLPRESCATFVAPTESLLPCASPVSWQAAWTQRCSPKSIIRQEKQFHPCSAREKNKKFCVRFHERHFGWHLAGSNSQWSRKWRSWVCSRTTRRSTDDPALRWSWVEEDLFRPRHAYV